MIVSASDVVFAMLLGSVILSSDLLSLLRACGAVFLSRGLLAPITEASTVLSSFRLGRRQPSGVEFLERH